MSECLSVSVDKIPPWKCLIQELLLSSSALRPEHVYNSLLHADKILVKVVKLLGNVLQL